MSSNSQRLRTKNEITGMRVVAQYVQEFWECGWQPYDQRNDKGIDGLILMHKKNQDLGVKINVQVKCGTSYISSFKNDEIRISIDDAKGLLEHLEYWRSQLEPVILIFVNPSKLIRDKNGNIIKDDNNKPLWKESRLKAKAWWVDVKNTDIQPKGTTTIISINKENVFGEHSKGDFLKLVSPLLGKNGLKVIFPNSESNNLLISDNLKKDAREFYKKWKNNTITQCKAFGQNLIISRTGWRHIVLSRRGKERRVASLRLLGLAKQIINEVDNFYLLNQTEEFNQITQKLGIRALVKTKTQGEMVVQVVVLRRIWKNKSKWWFYSVHNRN